MTATRAAIVEAHSKVEALLTARNEALDALMDSGINLSDEAMAAVVHAVEINPLGTFFERLVREAPVTA